MVEGKKKNELRACRRECSENRRTKILLEREPRSDAGIIRS